jgi:uncharacterized protein (DUF1330 family)
VAVYALNLFDLAENDRYREYSRRAPEAIARHGGRVVALGGHPESLAGEGERAVMVLVEWPSRAALQDYIDDPGNADLHPLREDGTRNYLWWVYDRLEDLRPVLPPRRD